jgi:hypothetical protein
MRLNRIKNWPSMAPAVLLGIALSAPLSAMTRRPAVDERYLSCAIHVETLPGAGGFVPRLEHLTSGPAILSGTLIRYRLSHGRPDRTGELLLDQDLPSGGVTRIVVYSALGFKRCVAGAK